MSANRARPVPSSRRAGGPTRTGSAKRVPAQQAAVRRKHWGWASALAAVVVVIVGLVVVHIVAGSSGSAGSRASGSAAPSVGQAAPNASFTTLSGTTETVASLRGKPALLWLMTTWCSSCQASTQAIAKNLAQLEAAGVHVVEVENYDDLGQNGPSLQEFGKVLAGTDFTNPDWTFARSSDELTSIYNPQSDLDIYYLLSPRGKVAYVNSSPVSTMPQLLAAARSLS